MNQGGEPQRHDGLRLIAWGFGTTQVILFAGMLTLGIKDGEDSGRPMTAILVVATLHITALSLLIWMDDRGFGPSSLFFAFPAATAMVLTMIGVPGVFIALYIKDFDRWVYGEREAKRFEALKTLGKSAGSAVDGAQDG